MRTWALGLVANQETSRVPPSPLLRALREDDLESLAIAIAADENPRLPDVPAHLDRLARAIAPGVNAVDGHRRLGRLIRGAYAGLGLGTPETYDDPRLHLIDQVLVRRAGSPVALAVVLILLGRRLGVALGGVAFPGHFMVRYEASEPLFIDPTSGAFPFPADCLLDLAASELRIARAQAERFLEPVAARTFAVRLLQNLQRSHEERGDVGRAMLVADRLYEVTGSPIARCERGLRAAALGAPHAALEDLTAYLADHRDRSVSRAAAELSPTARDLN